MTTVNTGQTLWDDWCTVTGTPTDQRDEKTLRRFAEQAGASRYLLRRLRSRSSGVMNTAPAWPAGLQENDAALRHLLSHASARINSPQMHWRTRLALRRWVFMLVLISPVCQGGLGLSRRQAVALSAAELQQTRCQIDVDDDPAACPACAVWSWLYLISVNSGWLGVSVPEVAMQRDTANEHRHLQPDPGDWQDGIALLPAINRWGHIEYFTSMNIASLSKLIGIIDPDLLKEDVPAPESAPEPRKPVRHISDDEREAIFARADLLNARIEQLLAEETFLRRRS